MSGLNHAELKAIAYLVGSLKADCEMMRFTVGRLQERIDIQYGYLHTLTLELNQALKESQPDGSEPNPTGMGK